MSDFTMREAVYGGKCPTNVLFKTDFLCVVDESISRLLTGAWVTLYMTDVSRPTCCFVKAGNWSHTPFGNGTYAPEKEPTPRFRSATRTHKGTPAHSPEIGRVSRRERV